MKSPKDIVVSRKYADELDSFNDYGEDSEKYMDRNEIESQIA